MNYLMILKRRILRKISDSLQERDGWRIRTIHELNKLIGGPDIVRSTKAQKLKLWDHLHRM